MAAVHLLWAICLSTPSTLASCRLWNCEVWSAVCIHVAIELSKDFLWSYTWPLWRTVQANMSQQEQTDSAFNSMFVWNEFLTR